MLLNDSSAEPGGNMMLTAALNYAGRDYEIDHAQIERIPNELKARPQWVGWHYVERSGKRTKLPISTKSNGQLLNAKTNDPSTWGSMD